MYSINRHLAKLIANVACGIIEFKHNSVLTLGNNYRNKFAILE